jgi:hypothetical protein
MEKMIMQRKKAGRPAKAIKKETRTTVRFSKTEFFIITEKADKAGINLSDYIRQAAIQREIKPRLTDEDRHFVRQLIGMANNLNQLAKLCYQEGILRGMAYFETFRQKIDDILKRLKS